jgi:hypothetical protein
VTTTGLAAATTGAALIVITSFEQLPEEIVGQIYVPGELASEAELLTNFPASLDAWDADGSSVTVGGVTWERMCDEDFDVNAEMAFYFYSAVMPAGYALEYEWLAPIITVMIGGTGGTQGITPLSSTGTVDITGMADVEAIRTAIQDAIDNAGNTGNEVNVIGSFTDATTTLNLTISAGVTVNWAAEYAVTGSSNAISLANSGTFEVITGGAISADTGTAISAGTTGTLNISGGTLTSARTTLNSGTIHSSGATVRVSGGGTVSNTANITNASAIFVNNARLYVVGGAVNTEGIIPTIRAIGSSVVFVNDGNLLNNGMFINASVVGITRNVTTNTYAVGAFTDLTIVNATASWTNTGGTNNDQTGINYTHNTASNTGFIAVDNVTVEMASINSWDALVAAVSASDSGAVVTLTGNITGTEQLTIGRNLTLDLNGHTLNITISGNTQANGIQINTNFFLTIKCSV